MVPGRGRTPVGPETSDTTGLPAVPLWRAHGVPITRAMSKATRRDKKIGFRLPGRRRHLRLDSGNGGDPASSSTLLTATPVCGDTFWLLPGQEIGYQQVSSHDAVSRSGHEGKGQKTNTRVDDHGRIHGPL